MKKIAMLVGKLIAYIKNLSFIDVCKRGTISFVTAKSGIENGEHIYHFNTLTLMPSLMYSIIIVIIILQIVLPKVWTKDKHHILFKRLRLLNLLIFAILIAADCYAKGEIRPEYLIPFLLEVGIEIIHHILF